MMASSEGHVMCVDSLLDQGAYIDLHDRVSTMSQSLSVWHVSCFLV